jgi:purine catabolism regulator
MKLIDLLNKPAFHDVEVLAGKNGLGREIKNVTMMDAPDIIDFLFENDFLVTTAYHLKDDPAQLLELVQSMHKQECAGLGIKTHRFLENIPAEVIQYANTHQFPIMQIPLEKSLGEIVNTTLQYMLNERTSDLLTAFETHRKFTQHILKGKGIKKLLDDLSNMIGQRVILLDQHFQVHASSHSKHPISEIIMNLYADDFRLFLNSTACTFFI